MSLILASAAVPAHGGSRAEVFRRCVACQNECRGDRRTKAACVQSCLRQKAQDCRQNGHGPGPRTTCSCT